MHLLNHIPWIIKILSTLGLILVINRYAKNLLLSVAIGTLTLGFFSGHSVQTIIEITLKRFISPNNLLLIVIIFQVIALSELMSKSGLIQDLVFLIQRRVSKRASMAILPAILGLIPMPGGALFSAPLVDDCARLCDTFSEPEPIVKTEINYWFRHSWEFWWPLYPGILLAMDITGLNVWHFIIFGLPLSCLSLFSGYVFFIRKVKTFGDQYPGSEEKNKSNRSPQLTFVNESSRQTGPNINKTNPSSSGLNESARTNKFKGSWIIKLFSLIQPIVVVIGVYGLVQIFLPQIAKMNKYLPMSIGLIIACFALQLQRPLKLSAWISSIFKKKTVALALLVSIISIYGAFIEARLPGGILLVERMSRELNSFGIPVFVMVMLIPFISGLASGLALGFVGASLPIVMSFLGKDPSLGDLLSITALAYGFGYMGMMLSPVHLCLIVTNQYFKTRLSQSLKELIKPAAVVMAGSILIHFILLNVI